MSGIACALVKTPCLWGWLVGGQSDGRWQTVPGTRAESCVPFLQSGVASRARTCLLRRGTLTGGNQQQGIVINKSFASSSCTETRAGLMTALRRNQ